MPAWSPYKLSSTAACLCSILAPTENGLGSRKMFLHCKSSKVSLEEWPIASIRADTFSSLSPADIVCTLPLAIARSVRAVSNLTSPPSSIILFRIAVTIFRRLSVPICGLAFVRISFGAPKSTKRSRTYLQRGSFIRVVSLPSENVPAPPSPNCTLQLVSSSPVSQNFCTDAVRFSIELPRSKIIGLYPCSARASPANIPAGPKPAMTTLPSAFSVDMTGL